MRRIRVSIAGLLIGIALLGVSLAALLHPSPLWGSVFYSMALGTLTIFLLAAIFKRGPSQAFWIGFCSCGWAYFLANFGPDPIGQVGPNLITTAILDISYPFTIPREEVGTSRNPAPPSLNSLETRTARTSRGGGKVILAGAFGGNVPATFPSPWEVWTKPDRMTSFNNSTSPKMYRRIGHSIFCLLFAFLGGFMAQRFHESRGAIGTESNRGSPG
jgi:hypothetical protein